MLRQTSGDHRSPCCPDDRRCGFDYGSPETAPGSLPHEHPWQRHQSPAQAHRETGAKHLSQPALGCLYVDDPVGGRPRPEPRASWGNLTGVTILVPGGLIAKSLQLLRELLPTARRIAVLINPTNEVVNRLLPIEALPAAAQFGCQLEVIEVREVEELAAAVARARQQGADALFVPGEAMFHSPPNRLPDLAAEAKLPALYLPRSLVEAGGLMSYSPDFDALERRGAHYADRILRGAHPAELPIEQPTRYQLVINLKTAKALGLDVPSSLLAVPDEIIE